MNTFFNNPVNIPSTFYVTFKGRTGSSDGISHYDTVNNGVYVALLYFRELVRSGKLHILDLFMSVLPEYPAIKIFRIYKHDFNVHSSAVVYSVDEVLAIISYISMYYSHFPLTIADLKSVMKSRGISYIDFFVKPIIKDYESSKFYSRSDSERSKEFDSVFDSLCSGISHPDGDKLQESIDKFREVFKPGS